MSGRKLRTLHFPHRLYFLLVLAALLAAIAAAPARAAEEQADPTEQTMGTVFKWLNFAQVFGGVAYLVAKKGPTFFRARAAAIASGITEAAAAKREAERVLREAEEKLARLDEEAAGLRAEARKESAAEAERIRALAREEGEKIARAGRGEIDAAERAARMELRQHAAGLAIERAEALVRQRLNPAAEAGLFQTFVKSLPRSAN